MPENRHLTYSWLISLSITGIFLVCTYLLLTEQNSFNFNNNYHLIGLLAGITLLVDISIFMLVKVQWHWPEALPVESAGTASEAALPLGYFIFVLMNVFLAIIPPATYLLLLDDFSFTRAQFLPASLGGGLFLYGYWGRFARLLDRRGWVQRLIYLLVFILISIVMLELANDILPAPLAPGSQQTVYSL